MTLIEKMARAIAGTLREEFPKAMDDYDQMGGRAKQRYLDMAKAALSAIEPTEAMIEAGRAAFADAMSDLGGASSRGTAGEIFYQMINAAKGEPDA